SNLMAPDVVAVKAKIVEIKRKAKRKVGAISGLEPSSKVQRTNVPLPYLPYFVTSHVIFLPLPTSQEAALTSSSKGVSPPFVEGSAGCVGGSSSPSSAEATGALESIAPLLRGPSSSRSVENSPHL
ncbi:unnamed protein product, partial [Ilex paraguariensis]